MSFSFGFFAENDSASTNISKSTDWMTRIESEIVPDEHKARVVQAGSCLPNMLKFDELRFQTYSIYHPSKDSVGEFSDNNDLIPRVYEGGLKLWECTIDLLEVLPDEISIFDDVTKINVLDLGCGQGLLGIAALVLGCSSVTFSDFNELVLTDTTWPGIMKNCPQLLGKAICYAGDWISLHRIFQDRQILFDLILTAETSYSTESCEKSMFFISKRLAPGGIALIATKRFYFGVGGGSASIEELIGQSESLGLERKYSFEDGHSNVRDIYKITRRR